MRNVLAYKALSFQCADAMVYRPCQPVDGLLCIDVLEHVETPSDLLQQLDTSLKPGGYVIISVPTPLYPRLFGRAFHEEIGHVVEGYTLSTLSALMPASYRLVTHTYNTGTLTWPGCFLYYRLVRNVAMRPLRLALSTLLMPFRWLDGLNGEMLSASLFAIYQKP